MSYWTPEILHASGGSIYPTPGIPAPPEVVQPRLDSVTPNPASVSGGSVALAVSGQGFTSIDVQAVVMHTGPTDYQFYGVAANVTDTAFDAVTPDPAAVPPDVGTVVVTDGDFTPLTNDIPWEWTA